jgi:hypothetical protein
MSGRYNAGSDTQQRFKSRFPAFLAHTASKPTNKFHSFLQSRRQALMTLVVYTVLNFCSAVELKHIQVDEWSGAR